MTRRDHVDLKTKQINEGETYDHDEAYGFLFANDRSRDDEPLRELPDEAERDRLEMDSFSIGKSTDRRVHLQVTCSTRWRFLFATR